MVEPELTAGLTAASHPWWQICQLSLYNTVGPIVTGRSGGVACLQLGSQL